MARYTHKLVKETAIGIAREVYEMEAKARNAFYAKNKNADVWVAKNWKRFLVPARRTLSQMLSMKYPDAMKEEIYEALLDDRSIPKGGNSMPVETLH